MSIPSDTELLAGSCLAASSFPKNIVRHATPLHHLEGYFERLRENAKRIFCEDGKAGLDILEYDDIVKEYQHTCATSIFELKGRLEGGRLYDHNDPRCRILFVHAPHSRERLRISLKMFVCALTHHQVMPAFLDFIFPFGLQEYLQDFYFSGFREDTRLLSTGLIIPNLGRSGREIRLCYSLKSVEASNGNTSWPWSIRQTAIYHSFDLETGKSFWIVVKGNQLMKKRVQAAIATGADDQSLKSFETTAKAFASTLKTHLMISDWCDEEWRWYLNYIEQRLQDATRRFLATIRQASQVVEKPAQLEIKHTSSILRTFSNFTKRTISSSSRFTKSSSGLEKVPYQPSFPQPASPVSPLYQTEGPPPPPTIPPGMPGAPAVEISGDEEDFTFRDLQKLQFIEENANEVSVVLEANIDILAELKQHYHEIFDSQAWPNDIKSGCAEDAAQFQKRLSNIITDLQRQNCRTKILQRLLSDRKSLLYGILNNNSFEASKLLAKKTQVSTERMEAMTNSMHEIAKKTKLETVSMKIITLVTLFFLPGTFISTIMSTDIIKFQASPEKTGKIFQLEALQIYLAITVPFMVFTFSAWYGLYWWSRRRDNVVERVGRVKSWSSYT